MGKIYYFNELSKINDFNKVNKEKKRLRVYKKLKKAYIYSDRNYKRGLIPYAFIYNGKIFKVHSYRQAYMRIINILKNIKEEELIEYFKNLGYNSSLNGIKKPFKISYIYIESALNVKNILFTIYDILRKLKIKRKNLYFISIRQEELK